MTPAEYNERQHNRGFLTWERYAVIADEAGLDPSDPLDRAILDAWSKVGPGGDWELATDVIAVWQSTVELVDDGMFGPASLKRYQQLYEIPEVIHTLAEKAVLIAASEIGTGEEHTNNAGVNLHRYRNWPFGDRFKQPIGNWCAFFVIYCLRESSRQTMRSLPFNLMFSDKRRAGKLMPIGSAKRTTERIAAAGKRVGVDDLRRGDVVCWHRGMRDGQPTRSGHIALVESVDGDRVTIIEGNVGRFPAKVARRTFTRTQMRRRAGRRFYLGARIV